MRLKDITGRFDTDKFYKGKYKKFECHITYSAKPECWYYCTYSNDERDIRYNSLWENERFKSQEECMKACQHYIDEVIKNAEISKKMG